MSYLYTALIASIFGGIIVHFGWAAFHKAEVDAKDVLIDELRQAKEWAERKVAEFKARI